MSLIFNVIGMTCGHCEKAVAQAIKQLDPQAIVQIDRSQNKVEVMSNQAREALIRAIAQAGYAVKASV